MGFAQPARRCATPALLAGSLGAWFAFRGAGVPAVVCSVGVTAAVVGALLVLEWGFPRTDVPARPAGTLASDLAFNVLTLFVAIVLPAVVLVPLGHALGDALGTTGLWPRGGRLATDAIACVLLVDFTSYWWHRLQHTTGDSWLWRLHSVHHSPRHFDLWIGARVHPLDVVVFTLVGYVLLALAGAPQAAIDVAAFFASMVGLVHHTRTAVDCGWLNRVIPFADQHVVHHSLRVEDTGNYGNITTLFDQLFGTWRTPTPRRCAPIGAWSLAPGYPQGDFVFQLRSPFGRAWRQARGGASTDRGEAIPERYGTDGVPSSS